MHPCARATLSGIDACRRHLEQHPGQPVTAVNDRFDFFAAATAGVHEAGGRRRGWVELHPHSAGIAIRLARGARRWPGPTLTYPARPAPDPWPDPDAPAAPPFLAALARAVERALIQLAHLPEDHRA